MNRTMGNESNLVDQSTRFRYPRETRQARNQNNLGANLRKIIITVAALALAGCTTVQELNANAIADATPATARDKESILSAARDVLYDPYSVRDAEISKVILWTDGFGQQTRWVCVKFNSKNALGGYTGRQQHLIYLTLNGELFGHNQDIFAQAHCNKMTYSRFHEADRLREL
jgi:hypothetical protein